jgi:ABC-type Fe3+ transport system permease subunit
VTLLEKLKKHVKGMFGNNEDDTPPSPENRNQMPENADQQNGDTTRTGGWGANQRLPNRATCRLIALSFCILVLAGFTGYQWQQGQRQRVELLGLKAQELMPTQPVDGTINAIAAVGLSQSPMVGFPSYSLPNIAYGGLLTSVQESRKLHQFQGGSASNVWLMF